MTLYHTPPPLNAASDYRERVQRLKQRVIAAKTNSLPVMSIAECFCRFKPDIPQGGMSGFFVLKFEKGGNYMEDENELIQVTIRLPLRDKERIDNLAKSGGCSTAEIIRRSVNGNLSKYLDAIQYVDREQGEVIKKLLEKFFTEISGMRTELRRIGVNYNQEVRLQNLGKQFRTGEISMSETLKMHQYITEECKGFSPEAINEIMDRFDSIVEEFVNVMAYTRISHTRNGKAAIQYARGNGRGHNGHAKRNLLIGGVGMLPDEVMPFEEQMAEDWARASGKNKNQVRRVVASFSTKELDPHNTDCAYTALEIAQEFVEEAYPNRKAAIFVQNDGKGEKLHVHILVSNVDSVEHKGCTDDQTKFEYVKQNFNQAAGRHITLDNGKKAKDKFTQAERALEEENEEAVENGGAAAYIWKDDLRERIRIAMENATSEDDFLEALEDEGVKSRYGTSKRYGEYISYELVDVPAHMERADRKYRARSYTLGDAYGVEALREKLGEKAKERLRMAEQCNHATESKRDLSDISQSGFNMETAAYLPMNKTPEMKCVPEVKQKSVRMVADTINAIVSGLYREAGAETPIPAQPAPTTPPMAAEGDGRADSTPEGKQPVQSATAPRERSAAYAEILRLVKKENEEEAKRQLENQQDDMDWFPRR